MVTSSWWQTEVSCSMIPMVYQYDIAKHEELLADYGDSYRDRVAMYVETIQEIDHYNTQFLRDEELRACAFRWFINEGFQLLNEKHKVTVPIHNRFPAKSAQATSLSAVCSHKDETAWGYVSQFEKLLLERAREDCWVSFKPGRYWNPKAFEEALTSTSSFDTNT